MKPVVSCKYQPSQNLLKTSMKVNVIMVDITHSIVTEIEPVDLRFSPSLPLRLMNICMKATCSYNK